MRPEKKLKNKCLVRLTVSAYKKQWGQDFRDAMWAMWRASNDPDASQHECN